ncbi:MAG: ankyrin repeat domain-containing protein [Rickettsiales bacterium]|jgi:ankyrin repeat protein|nr:ankyrin repeat domain-containing protein [Rickettsiales bacterium]
MLNSVEHHDLYEILRRYRENKNERTDYEHLVGEHADINAKDSQGRTALHYAACFNDTNMAELLLDARADINTKDDQGRTALHYAACFNNTDMVELLLDAGAKTNIKDNNGKKPLSLAKNKEIIDLLRGLPARCLSNVMVSCLLAILPAFCEG